MPKREDYLNWDEYFMGVAVLSALRSKDPSTQVGACVASPENKVVTMGYNGMPSGCPDDELPWEREAESKYDTKYPYVCHAEFNAILNSLCSLQGCRIYVTLFPCNECAKAIIQAGIKEVIYIEDKYANTIETRASKRLFDLAKIKYRQYEGRAIDIKVKDVINV